jgi:hypothetical protein
MRRDLQLWSQPLTAQPTLCSSPPQRQLLPWTVVTAAAALVEAAAAVAAGKPSQLSAQAGSC